MFFKFLNLGTVCLSFTSFPVCVFQILPRIEFFKEVLVCFHIGNPCSEDTPFPRAGLLLLMLSLVLILNLLSLQPTRKTRSYSPTTIHFSPSLHVFVIFYDYSLS